MKVRVGATGNDKEGKKPRSHIAIGSERSRGAHLRLRQHEDHEAYGPYTKAIGKPALKHGHGSMAPDSGREGQSQDDGEADRFGPVAAREIKGLRHLVQSQCANDSVDYPKAEVREPREECGRDVPNRPKTDLVTTNVAVPVAGPIKPPAPTRKKKRLPRTTAITADQNEIPKLKAIAPKIT